jgi:large subunit ribosomal protein L35
MKTHKGLRKRVKVSSSGKVKYKSSFTGHLMSSRSAKRRRRLRLPKYTTDTMAAKIREALGE